MHGFFHCPISIVTRFGGTRLSFIWTLNLFDRPNLSGSNFGTFPKLLQGKNPKKQFKLLFCVCFCSFLWLFEFLINIHNFNLYVPYFQSFWEPLELFWKSRTLLNLPFLNLPYFSNMLTMPISRTCIYT